MASKLLRRSGVAVGLIAELLGWKPDSVWQVGVGLSHEEIFVLKEEWGMPKENMVGFEPNPHTFAKISDTYPGLLFNIALSDFIGQATLTFNTHHSDGGTLKSLVNGESVKREPVIVSTLNSFPGGENILLWLDCEGSELDVLRGGYKFLDKVNVVNVEMTGKPSGSGWCNPLDVYLLLKSYGFRLQHVHTHRTTAGQFDAVFVRSHLFKPEYCCCFAELIEDRNRKGFW